MRTLYQVTIETKEDTIIESGSYDTLENARRGAALRVRKVQHGEVVRIYRSEVIEEVKLGEIQFIPVVRDE